MSISNENEFDSQFNRLNQELVNPSDFEKYYVDRRDSYHGKELVNMLQISARPQIVLFSGQAGSGKTTELHNLKLQLEQDSDFLVIMLSPFRNEIHTKKMEYVDILLVLFSEFLFYIPQEIKLSKTMVKELTYLLHDLNNDKDIQFSDDNSQGIARGFLDLISLKLNKSEESRQDFRMRSENMISRMLSLFDNILEIIENTIKKKIIIMVDNLEKNVDESLINFLTNHEELIRRRNCSFIFTVNSYFSFNQDIPLMYRSYDLHYLPFFTIRNKDDSINYDQVHMMKDIVHKRISSIVIDDQPLELAIMYSGGSISELFRILKKAKNKANTSNELKISTECIKKAFYDIRQTLPGITSFEFKKLREIHKIKELHVGEMRYEQLKKYLHNCVVLTYRNVDSNYADWYDLNPFYFSNEELENLEQDYELFEKNKTNELYPPELKQKKKEDTPKVETKQSPISNKSKNITRIQKKTETELSAHTSTDKWVIEDSLGYRVYAHSVFKFLTHEKTKPPLTINIQAPWGGGKTSIMRMIQNKLDPDGVYVTTEKNKRKLTNNNTKLKQILSVLKGKKTEFYPPVFIDSDRRFTVWFNPWKYQNTEQIWSGLAHSIITQFSERLNDEERKKFLLDLNVKRTGKGNPLKKIKNQILSNWKEQLSKYVWTYLSGIAGSSIITVVGSSSTTYANWLPIGQIGIIASILVGGAVSGLQYRNTENKIKDEPAASILDEFVVIPDYSSSLGSIHHVHEDLQRVFEIIQEKMQKKSDVDNPLVIFIDDLDRCSPGKVAEVIEAINMFISAEFSNCIFVMGMDTQLVASALEKHYQDIIEKLPEYSKQISMGWKFMDKFVQLPVIIPPPDAESTKNYVNSLMLPKDEKTVEQEEAIQVVNKVPEKELDNIKTSIDLDRIVQKLTRIGNRDEESSNKVKKQALSTKLHEHRSKKAEKEIDKASVVWSDNNPDVQNQVAKAAADFSDNPREIKRFLNVLRFNEVTQEGRKELKLKTPPDDVLRRWIILTMKWPQVSLWIQRGSLITEYDRTSNNNTNKQLEQLERTASKSPKEWNKMLMDMLRIQNKPDNVPWVKDENLKKFFERENKEKGMKLSQAVGLGLY